VSHRNWEKAQAVRVSPERMRPRDLCDGKKRTASRMSANAGSARFLLSCRRRLYALHGRVAARRAVQRDRSLVPGRSRRLRSLNGVRRAALTLRRRSEERARTCLLDEKGETERARIELSAYTTRCGTGRPPRSIRSPSTAIACTLLTTRTPGIDSIRTIAARSLRTRAHQQPPMGPGVLRVLARRRNRPPDVRRPRTRTPINRARKQSRHQDCSKRP
jgi:hypothetical protein